MGRQEGSRQLARCCQEQPRPRFRSNFPALLFFLSAPSTWSCYFCFFFPFHQLPCFGFWQTKLVSPLIRKAGFFGGAWRHPCRNQLSREERGSHLHRPWPKSGGQPALGHGALWGGQALTALWLERGLSPQWQGASRCSPMDLSYSHTHTPPPQFRCTVLVHPRPPTPPGRQVQTPLSEGDPPLSRDHSPGANSFPSRLQPKVPAPTVPLQIAWQGWGGPCVARQRLST